MYAMLTGCLPYTVEPFNITALHAKMLENKMNPIPTSLSSGRHHMRQSLSNLMNVCFCRMHRPFVWATEL